MTFNKGHVPWNKGKTNIYSDETKTKISEANKGRVLSKETKRKMSEARKGKNNPMYGKTGSDHPNYGKTHSEETKRKMRLARITDKEKKHGQLIPNYNPEACKLIEKYGRKHGYEFQHAENGGEFHIKELGFWVDGYDIKRNIVIEVYESRHHRTVGRDNRRQQEIEEHLKCEFIILWI